MIMINKTIVFGQGLKPTLHDVIQKRNYRGERKKGRDKDSRPWVFPRNSGGKMNHPLLM